MSDVVGIPGNRIRSFVERIEQIENEIKELNEAKKEVFSEAKGEGFDVKILKEIIKLRKQDQDERDEHESLLDVYMRAMDEAGPAPVAEAAWQRLRASDNEKAACDEAAFFAVPRDAPAALRFFVRGGPPAGPAGAVAAVLARRAPERTRQDVTGGSDGRGGNLQGSGHDLGPEASGGRHGPAAFLRSTAFAVLAAPRRL
jgi:uncharacterized protein (UPF0335 family)